MLWRQALESRIVEGSPVEIGDDCDWVESDWHPVEKAAVYRNFMATGDWV